MLGQGVEDRPPTHAWESVGDVELDPGVPGPVRRHRLHRVHQLLPSSSPPSPKLVLPNGFLQGLAVLPHQRPRREFPEALAAGDGTNPPTVLEERRELRQAEQVDRAVREVAVG